MRTPCWGSCRGPYQEVQLLKQRYVQDSTHHLITSFNRIKRGERLRCCSIGVEWRLINRIKQINEAYLTHTCSQHIPKQQLIDLLPIDPRLFQNRFDRDGSQLCRTERCERSIESSNRCSCPFSDINLLHEREEWMWNARGEPSWWLVMFIICWRDQFIHLFT